jgi:hypothetical protein
MTSRTTFTEPGRLIFGLMVFTVSFSLVGGEIEKGGGAKPTVNPATIIFGGTVATSLLTLISHGGEVGERVGVGLALIAFTTSALVYGKPVWDAMNKAFGSTPTKPIGITTGTTAATPTIATSTAIAAATG